jgi:hypothetical protein
MKVLPLSTATEWRSKVAHGETVGIVVKTGQAPERGERNARRSVFCRPIRGLNVFSAIQPTVSPWATFWRASGALAAMILFFAGGAVAQTTNTLSDAEIQGHQLAQQLLEQKPATNYSQNGVLKIRDENGKHLEFPFQYEVNMGPSFVCDWSSSYTAILKPNADGEILSIRVRENQPNTYFHHLPWHSELGMIWRGPDGKSDAGIMTPFAGSDFWLADLGLEFFHWPDQKILKHEIRRGRACKVLESTNPSPSTNGYARVVSWIDNESGGIVQAEAYDFKNKLLKEFAPKSFKKMNGQWELQEMEIRNVQTGSRTRLEFDLKKE